MTRYVCGFLFDPGRERVALIRKERPEWQRGLWNGVGGKVWPGESPKAAMAREFAEEAGVAIEGESWSHIIALHGDGWCVDFFAAFSDDIDSVATSEDEQVAVHYVTELPTLCVGNLYWLIPLALDRQMGSLGRHIVKETQREA